MTDEFGVVRGMVTASDFLSDIVGEFATTDRAPGPSIRPDGENGWILDGLVEFDELARAIPGFPHPDAADYVTVAGFILDQLQHLPAEGEKLRWKGFEFEVLDMDRQRIDKLRIRKDAAGADPV